MRTAVLTSGETIDYDGENNDGIMTDAGLIPWSMVMSFVCVDQKSGRTVTIPLN